MKRTAVVLFLAAVAAAVPLLWPAWPAWQLATAGHVAGFSADGERLFIGESTPHVGVRTYATATGRELAAVMLHDIDPVLRTRPLTVVASPDGTRVVAYSPANSGVTAEHSAVGSLHDAATGRRLAAFAGGGWQMRSFRFSPRGRWLAAVARDRNTGATYHSWIELYDAATGQPLAPVPPIDGASLQEVLFRDDDTAAAFGAVTPRGDGPPAIELRALPSLALAGWVTPPGPMHLTAWRGGRLTLMQGEFGYFTRTGRRYTTFDTAADPVGPGEGEPHLSSAVGDRSPEGTPADGTWVLARYRRVSDRLPGAFLKWGADRTLWAYADEALLESHLSRIDPATGTAVAESPVRTVAHPIPSPDGRWVAVAGDGRVRVWPIGRPWPRGAGALVVAGTVLILGRRRKR